MQADEHEAACARVVARFSRGILQHYVKRKIRHDPAYPAVFEAVRNSSAPLLDVGCGVGLLPFYLRARGFKNPIIAIDLDSRKIHEANRAGNLRADEIDFRQTDVRDGLPPFCGNVVALDLLHYLAPAQQQQLLSAMAARVADDASMLLRDAVADGSARFWLTYAGEKLAQLVRWNISGPLCFPSRKDVMLNFPPHDFSQRIRPLWGATPFNNHLFTFRRRLKPAVVPAME